MTETVLLIGTRKGLWLARSADRHTWEVGRADDDMSEVHAVGSAALDGGTRLYASSRSWHFGPQLRRSDDGGRTWQSTPGGEVVFPEHTGRSLEAVWAVAASQTEPGVVWAGTEPSALFRSEDGGASFALVRSLWDHPHREEWGAGFGGQAIHTVLPHPTDPSRVTVAMSTGGVYRTADGGASWEPANQGIKAEFMPEEIAYPAFGQCVHKVARSAGQHDVLYAQNHGGVYRTDDGGDHWESIAAGLPSDFGFPVVTHPHRDGTVYVFPLVAAWERFPADGICRVWRSRDRGDTWEPLEKGLPASGFYTAVMRDAFCADRQDPVGLYLGARDGTVFGSADEGETWTVVAEHLPDVLSVRAATL